MDQTIVGNVPDDARFGDMVGVMGPAGGGPSLDEVAAFAETINYEITTSMSARVPRYYWREGNFVAVLEEGILRDTGI